MKLQISRMVPTSTETPLKEVRGSQKVCGRTSLCVGLRLGSDFENNPHPPPGARVTGVVVKKITSLKVTPHLQGRIFKPYKRSP